MATSCSGGDGREHLGPLARRAQLSEGAGHDVHRQERSGLDVPAQLLGDDGRVQQAMAADAPAAVGLSDEHGEPAELASPAQPGAVIAHGVLVKIPHGGRGQLGLDEADGGLVEEALVVGELEIHLNRVPSNIRPGRCQMMERWAHPWRTARTSCSSTSRIASP